jgi:hypothetical protein
MQQRMMEGDDDIRLLERQEPDRRGYGRGTLPRAAPAIKCFSFVLASARGLGARVTLTNETLKRNAPACLSRLLLLDMLYPLGIVR